MIFLILLGAMVVVAVVAIVLMVRIRARRGDAEPEKRRRNDRRVRADADGNPPPEGLDARDMTSTELADLVSRRRREAGRLVAGHVHLIDMHALVDNAPTDTNLSMSKVLRITEEMTRRMIRDTDVVVVMKPDGIAILFDGASAYEAKQKSEQIAEAVMKALGQVGFGDQFVAKGFGYELEEVLKGASIDGVEDMIRFVRIAHQSYVQKERGIAKTLMNEVELRCIRLLEPDGSESRNQIIGIFRRGADGKHKNVSFEQMDAASGSELDCVVLEKLVRTIERFLGNDPDARLLLPMRTEGLVNPLYMENVTDGLDKLDPAASKLLIPVLTAPSPSSRSKLPDVIRKLRARVADIGVEVRDPRQDIQGLAQSGAGLVILDGVTARFKSPGSAINVFASLVLAENLFPIALDVEGGMAAVEGLKTPITHST